MSVALRTQPGTEMLLVSYRGGLPPDFSWRLSPGQEFIKMRDHEDNQMVTCQNLTVGNTVIGLQKVDVTERSPPRLRGHR